MINRQRAGCQGAGALYAIVAERDRAALSAAAHDFSIYDPLPHAAPVPFNGGGDADDPSRQGLGAHGLIRRLAYIAARLALVRCLDLSPRCAGRLAIVRDGYGRPVLDAARTAGSVGGLHAAAVPSFSVSHCQDVAIVGVGVPGPIGVDAERFRQVRGLEKRRETLDRRLREVARLGGDLSIAADAFGGASTGASASTDGIEDLMTWVRFEAAAKADGRGGLALLRGAPAGCEPLLLRSAICPASNTVIAVAGPFDVTFDSVVPVAMLLRELGLRS